MRIIALGMEGETDMRGGKVSMPRIQWDLCKKSKEKGIFQD